MKIIFVFFTLCVVLNCSAYGSNAGETVKLVTSDHPPYIGQELDNYGYVHELVTEIFQRVGYDVEIHFYPWSRAIKMTEDADSDGIMPICFDESHTDHFVFSDPFPGGQIGLLKRKDLAVSYAVDPTKDPIKALRSLQDYDFGTVRRMAYTTEFDQAEFLKKHEVTEDVQNLRKLGAKRIDFVVIDKYTAADLMTHHLPHLIGQFEFMKPPLATKSFHLAFSKASKGYKKRANAFNRGLREVMRDGSLEKILARHGLLETNTSEPGKTIVRIATLESVNMIMMQRLTPEFERLHPDIKLEWYVLDENILRLRTKSDLAISDGKYDVITIGSYAAPLWGKAGWLTPIANLPKSYDLDDVFESVRDGLSSDGTLYALPFYAESSMMFYNTTLFKKAGLTMPDAPTYDEIKRFAAALHRPGQNIYGICLRGKAGWGSNMVFFNSLVYTFGGRWFDEQWNTTIDTPEWRKALTLYHELMTQYGPPNGQENCYNELLRLFRNSQCGMWIDATVFAGILTNPKTSKVAGQVGFAQAPIAVTPKGSHWMWIWALGIPTSSKVPDAAKEFVLWATSKEYIELVAREEGWVAAPPGTRKSTYQNPRYRAAAPFADAVLNAIQTTDSVDMSLKPVPYTGILYILIPEYTAIGTQVGKIIAKAVEGNVSIDQALQEAQKVVSRQMKEFGYTK